MIKFSVLQQVGGFLQVLRFPPPIKLTGHNIAEILIKVALNTIKQTNDSTICYVESSFLGHQNDAQQFMLMKQIGIYLPFPDNLYLLGDKICPNRHDKDAIYMSNLQLICRKMNRLITEYGVKEKYAMGGIKC